MGMTSQRPLRGIPVLVTLLCALRFASAQGIYTSQSANTTTVYADTEGYGTSNSCGVDFGLSSDFDGSYDDGSDAYPYDIEFWQNTNYTTGVNYPWDISLTFDVPDPYSGCYVDTINIGTYLRIGTTYYDDNTNNHQIGAGTCDYAGLACTSGTPSCTFGDNDYYGIGLYVPPNCPSIIKALWLVVDGSCDAAVSLSSYVGGACN